MGPNEPGTDELRPQLTVDGKCEIWLQSIWESKRVRALSVRWSTIRSAERAREARVDDSGVALLSNTAAMGLLGGPEG